MVMVTVLVAKDTVSRAVMVLVDNSMVPDIAVTLNGLSWHNTGR